MFAVRCFRLHLLQVVGDLAWRVMLGVSAGNRYGRGIFWTFWGFCLGCRKHRRCLQVHPGNGASLVGREVMGM